MRMIDDLERALNSSTSALGCLSTADTPTETGLSVPPARGVREQALVRDVQALMELLDHSQAQWPLAIEYLRDPSARPDVGLQVACRQPLRSILNLMASTGSAGPNAQC